jgi:hypothetical protein
MAWYTPGYGNLGEQMKRKSILLVVSMLLLSALACGTGGALTRRNNQVRRSALAYELSTHGPVDEVLVSYGLTEVRDNLGFEGGNTVWLNRFAVNEYLRTRDKDESYLFLHDPEYTDETASMVIDRGEANGLQSYQLTLRRAAGTWEVSSEQEVESSSPASN